MTLTEHSKAPAATSALVATISADGGAAIVALRGEADLATLPLVVNVLARVIAESEGAIIVDLTSAEFIDTSTARALARAWQFLDDRGRTLTVRSPSRLALRVLTLLGLGHSIEPDRSTVA
jgi:anti-anti-sigma factor